MNEGKYYDTDFKWTFDNFEDFVEYLSDILKYPVTLVDINHNVLAYSNHENVTNLIRLKTIMGKQVPETVINCLWNQGIISTLLESDQPIRINRIEEIDLADRVVISIHHKKDMLGYIWIIEDGMPLNEDALDFLYKSAKVISPLMIQYYASRDRLHRNYQDFFWQLLLGNVWPDDEIKKRLNDMNLYPYKFCTVLIFRFLEEVAATFQKKMISMLSDTKEIQIVFHIFNKKNLIVLISIDKEDSSIPCLNRFIKLFINHIKLKLGIDFIDGVYGGLYENYSMIEISYAQALAVLDMKDKFPGETQSILGFNDLGMYKFINNIMDVRKSRAYKNPFLNKLRAYDHEHNQRFIETLEVYLDCDCNTYETSNILHIHMNTLTYRLKRIREIGGIDLNNFNQKIGIYIDLKIEKILNNNLLN